LGKFSVDSNALLVEIAEEQEMCESNTESCRMSKNVPLENLYTYRRNKAASERRDHVKALPSKKSGLYPLVQAIWFHNIGKEELPFALSSMVPA
jgi:hypothetical protein